jgi:peptidoglycan/xylan/chitin deacetylase (PgdA/CDA1 family)
MFFHNLYYTLKPFIPRWVQIQVRRRVALRKRARYADVWPIDERAAKPPEGWTGWPEGKKFALVLMHDVDTALGHEKCLQLMQLDEKMGFRSSFNFVPERYNVSSEVRRILIEKGFEIGVHGLKHDGKLFSSRETFLEQAVHINRYLKDWKSVGFVSPSMHRNLDWIHDLNVEYDASTFDTDPFEPHPEGVSTIFPFWVPRNSGVVEGLRLEVGGQTPTHNSINPINPTNPSNSSNCSTLNTQHSNNGYIELPYTLPQDHALFIIMGEKNINIWKKKLDWIAQNGGMALLITHPDYMSFDGRKPNIKEYPVKYYEELLNYIKSKYEGQYWHVLPKEMSHFWKQKMVISASP